MADETSPTTDPEPQPTDVEQPVTADTPPADDDSAEKPTCADGDDEDPELFIGDEIPDPWDDKFQTDWPQNEVTA